VAKKLAVLAQEESPDFGFTVWQEVMLGRSPHHGGLHFDSRSDRKIVATAMEKARVSHLADRMMAELSGGERQRVRIARGLAQEPRVLFLDEPTNHLDLNSQLALIDLMREINSEGLGILLVSHDINFVGRTCRQIKVLHQKVFLYSGEPHEVITPRNLAEAFGIRAIVDTHPVDGSPRMTPVERLSGPEERTKAERSSNNQNWNTRHSGA
jgi:iron complex transport system ATP-binding protein